MLVLSRRKEESIVIGNQIEVQILKIKGNVVRLGIKAPQNVKILRSEVCPFDVEFEVAQEDFRNADLDQQNVEAQATSSHARLPQIVSETLSVDASAGGEAVA